MRRRTGIRYRRKSRFSARSPRGLPLLLASVCLIAGTLMYLTTQTNEVTNAFAVGQNSIQIVEDVADQNAVDWGSTGKPVKLRNPNELGNVPGVVRAMIVPYLEDMVTGDRVGGSLGTLAEPVGNTMVLGDITFHFAPDWSTNWFYKDGFFYYRKVLEPGQETSQLLAGVTLEAGKEAEYDEIRVKVDVAADILQTEGGAPGAEWGVNVAGNVVSP